jgi:asparagine synthase (glutamine-hydrolysing)
MNRALDHRGPDASGVKVELDGCVGLAHTRLSIIDLSPAGSQPMVDEAGEITITFNGEIYNFSAIRSELIALGHVFRSRSDTEVILQAYRRWGTGSFSKLNGIFAFAIFDRRTRSVFLVRDRLGIKPLYIARMRESIVFGSEIKAILASGRVPAEPDIGCLHEYLYFGNALGRHTFYSHIDRVCPGHFIKINAETLESTTSCYWSVNVLPQLRVSEADAVAEVRSLLAAAVKRQLVADVPVGLFLSGGIDSSALLALATRECGGRMQTYAAGFDYVGDANELPTARKVAAVFGSDHHEVAISAPNLPLILNEVVRAHDGPFGDAANIPLYQLAQQVSSSVKVVLQGDGGDELFGGYRRYEYLALPSIAYSSARMAVPVLSALAPMLGKGGVRALRFMQALAAEPRAEQMALLLSTEGPHNLPTQVLSRDVQQEVIAQNPFARYEEVAAQLNVTDRAQAMLHTDIQILLPDIFLEKVDRPTMAHGLEARVPFLDNEIVDYVCALPAVLKVRLGHKKKLLKQALRGIVPDFVLDGRKTGFGVPVSAWLQGPLREFCGDLLCAAPSRSLLDGNLAIKLLDEHASGRRDYGALLWKTLQLALWLEQCHGLSTDVSRSRVAADVQSDSARRTPN